MLSLSLFLTGGACFSDILKLLFDLLTKIFASSGDIIALFSSFLEKDSTDDVDVSNEICLVSICFAGDGDCRIEWRSDFLGLSCFRGEWNDFFSLLIDTERASILSSIACSFRWWFCTVVRKSRRFVSSSNFLFFNYKRILLGETQSY